MSTITVTNIKATGETASRAVSGVAAAFCVYDASSGTPTSLQSSNVSSLTDVSTGKCGVNFTNNMSATDNIISGAVGQGGNKNFMYDNNSASSVEAQTQAANTATYNDYNNVSAAIHGDLA